MKSLLITLFLSLSIPTAFCCNEGSKRHTNPDGTIGGVVGKYAFVSQDSFIAPAARVCGATRVERSQILGNSQVEGRAWIRNSIIRDYAVVGGAANVWGEGPRFSVVEGKSVVKGSSNVLAGSKVSSNSVLYGSPTLYRVSTKENAKICESVILSDVEIEDDTYCNPDGVSPIKLSFANVNETYSNPIVPRLEVKLSLPVISDDLTIEFNATVLTESQFKLQGNMLFLAVAAVNGINTLSITGRDKNYKSFVFSKKIIFGSGTQRLESVELNSTLKAKSSLDCPDGQFVIRNKIETGALTLLDVPSDIEGCRIVVSGIRKDKFLLYRSGLGEDEIEPIKTFSIPSFVNNTYSNPSLESGWSFSDINQLQIISEGGQTFSRVHSSSQGPSFSKVFKVENNETELNRSLVLGFRISVPLSTPVDVYWVHTQTGKFIHHTLSRHDLILGTNGFGELNLDLFAGPGEYFANIVLPPQSKRTDYYFDVSGILKKVSISFVPRALAAENKFNNSMLRTSEISKEKCDTSEYQLIADRYNISNQIQRYLSVGSLNEMDLGDYNTNRIFGDLMISEKKSNTRNIKLIVGHRVNNIVEWREFPNSLSICALAHLEKNPSETNFNFSSSENWSKSIFEIPFSDLDFSIVNGSKLFFYVEAEVFVNGMWELIHSDVSDVTPLVTTSIPSSDFYPSIDGYDSNQETNVKTGGDKWILKGYEPLLKEILDWMNDSSSIHWKINDLARLNGGTFPGHNATHWDGLDADIRFEPFTYDENQQTFQLEYRHENLTTPEKWKAFLDTLESLFKKMSPYYDLIRVLYLQRSEESEIKHFNIRFANRCFWGRTINFELQNGKGSLLKHAMKHSDHFHLRFNHTDGRGDPSRFQPLAYFKYDLTQFIFKIAVINGKNTLQVRPNNSIRQEFEGSMYLYWRFQDVLGFENQNMDIQIGNYFDKDFDTASFKQYEKYPNGDVDEKKYIYLSYGFKRSEPQMTNGGCLTFLPIEINRSKIKAASEWTYKKVGQKYEMVYLP